MQLIYDMPARPALGLAGHRQKVTCDVMDTEVRVQITGKIKSTGEVILVHDEITSRDVFDKQVKPALDKNCWYRYEDGKMTKGK